MRSVRSVRSRYRVAAGWLITAALLLLSVIGVALVRERTAPQDEPAAAARGGTAARRDAASDAPAVEMYGVEVVGRAHGETQWRLRGARISRAEGSDDLVRFEDVRRAILYRADGSTFQLRADAGEWHTSRNDLELWGDVELVWREGDPTGNGASGRGADPGREPGLGSGAPEPRLRTEGLQRLRFRADEGRVEFFGPFQLVLKVGDGA